MNEEELRILEKYTRKIFDEFDQDVAVVTIVVTPDGTRFASNMDGPNVIELCKELIEKLEENSTPIKVYPSRTRKQ